MFLGFSPNNSDAHELIGDIYGQDGRVSQAIKHYRQALKLDSRKVILQSKIGCLKSTLHQQESANEAPSDLQSDFETAQRFSLDLESQAPNHQSDNATHEDPHPIGKIGWLSKLLGR